MLRGIKTTRPHDRLRKALQFGQHGRVIDRLLFAGEGIGVRTDLVQLTIDVGGAAAGRSFERHMLPEMGKALLCFFFIPASNIKMQSAVSDTCS